MSCRRTLLIAALLSQQPASATGQPANRPEPAEAASVTLSDLDAMIRRQFGRADRNGDGVLETGDLAASTQGFRQPQEFGFDLVDWLHWTRADLNGGGPSEYQNILQLYWAALEDLDRNGDGTLTYAERRASGSERLIVVCPARSDAACAGAYRRNEKRRLERESSGRAFDRLDWWARRYYRFDSGIERPFYGIVRDYRAWHRLWDEVVSRHGTKRTNPAVDFGKDMLLVAATGTKPTGGYGIQIVSVRDTGKQLVATAVRRSPGRRCGATAALSSPADIVRVRASRKPVRWVFRDVATECP